MLGQSELAFSEKIDEYGPDGKAAILGMMREILVFRPEKRATAEEVMGCEWMVKWGLPQLKKLQKG